METWFVWLARLMYLGVFLMAGGMLYRAGRILLAQDMRFVSDWRGRALPEPARWAPWVLAVNFVGGGLLLAIAVTTLFLGLPFSTWTGAAALVLWSYYFFLRVASQRAHRHHPVKKT